MLTGSCLCRAIRYEVSVPITELRACHCKDCQKASGTAGSVNAMIPSSAFRITRGTPKRFSVTADSGRTLHRFFCGDCGSPLFSRREAYARDHVGAHRHAGRRARDESHGKHLDQERAAVGPH
jgi:hypothetical protein